MIFQSTWLAVVFTVALGLGLAQASRADDDKPVPQSEASAPAAAPSDDTGYVTEKRDGKTVKYKKKATYDFDGASIDGVYNKPSGSYISNIRDVKGRSIIRIRENFDAEVIDSGRLVK
jgi:hypothetical protein